MNRMDLIVCMEAHGNLDKGELDGSVLEAGGCEFGQRLGKSLRKENCLNLMGPLWQCGLV